MSRLPTEASFLKDVADHQMAVKLDSGLYRHLRFNKPSSWNMGFDLVTWPGFLVFSGDMGCYCFSRIPDMFEFFRRDTPPDGSRLYINPGYWSEKVEAIDRNGGLREYSPELFKAGIARWLDEAEASDSVRDAVESEILPHAEDENEAMRAAYEFNHEGFTFDLFYEVGVRELTFRFLWCCYAVAWAVVKYDEARAGVSARETEGVTP